MSDTPQNHDLDKQKSPTLSEIGTSLMHWLKWNTLPEFVTKHEACCVFCVAKKSEDMESVTITLTFLLDTMNKVSDINTKASTARMCHDILEIARAINHAWNKERMLSCLV